MDFAQKRVFYQRHEFQMAWEGLPKPPSLFGRFGRRGAGTREALNEAGWFLGGALLRDGFQTFKNGGLPLLERRTGPLIEEIVLRASPTVCHEPFVPVRVYLHLSHLGLYDVRLRYWRPVGRAPSYVSFMDLGQLELPPCWVIWNVGMDYGALVEMHDWIRRLALPWFNLFENPGELRRMLFRRTVSGLDLERSLELVLAEFGPLEAVRFLEECVLPDEKLGPLVQEATRRIKTASAPSRLSSDPVWNIAAIASAHSLM